MISLENMVAEATNPDIQRDLFRVLADYLALSLDTRPGLVVVLDAEALKDPPAMLAYLDEHCASSRN